MFNGGKNDVATHGKGASHALNKAVKQKQWDAAADILSGCVARTPNDPQLRLLAGEMSVRAGRREEAARHYLAGAEIYFRHGKLAKTAAVCKKAVALDPSLEAECNGLLSPQPRPASVKPTPPSAAIALRGRGFHVAPRAGDPPRDKRAVCRVHGEPPGVPHHHEAPLPQAP